jgi:uncharacterized protein YdcH (DUF465 family)
MTPELIAILAVGITLAAFGLTSLQLTFKRIGEVGARMDARFDRVDARFNRVDERFDRIDDRFERLEARVTEVEKGQAHLRGVLDVLREALFERSRS